MRFLIDEMFPPAVAELLRNRHGYDGVHVTEVGLGATDDPDVAAAARQQDRALVTENVVHVAGQHDLVLVFGHKRNVPAGRACWVPTRPGGYRRSRWAHARLGAALRQRSKARCLDCGVLPHRPGCLSLGRNRPVRWL